MDGSLISAVVVGFAGLLTVVGAATNSSLLMGFVLRGWVRNLIGGALGEKAMRVAVGGVGFACTLLGGVLAAAHFLA